MNHPQSDDNVKNTTALDTELARQKPERTSRNWLRRCVITILAMLSVLLWIYGSKLFGAEAREVDITVSVVDAVTGDPIPNAKIVIYTENYGVFDNGQLNFVDIADEKGNLSFHQSLPYAAKSVGVEAFDANLTKRGVVLRVTYAAFPVTGPQSQPGRYVHFNPTRKHYRVEVGK